MVATSFDICKTLISEGFSATGRWCYLMGKSVEAGELEPRLLCVYVEGPQSRAALQPHWQCQWARHWQPGKWRAREFRVRVPGRPVTQIMLVLDLNEGAHCALRAGTILAGAL